MMTYWRLGTVNGVLLALYFVPVWTASVLRIATFPLRGVYERGTIGPTLFLNDYFQLLAPGVVKMAWLLALGKFVVVAFFGVFVVFSLRGALAGRTDGREALTLALAIGALISFASMLMAAAVGEAGAVQLNATEALLSLGGLIVLQFETRAADLSAHAAAPSAGHHIAA